MRPNSQRIIQHPKHLWSQS